MSWVRARAGSGLAGGRVHHLLVPAAALAAPELVLARPEVSRSSSGRLFAGRGNPIPAHGRAYPQDARDPAIELGAVRRVSVRILALVQIGAGHRADVADARVTAVQVIAIRRIGVGLFRRCPNGLAVCCRDGHCGQHSDKSGGCHRVRR